MADEVNTQIKIDLYEDVLMGAVRHIRRTFRVSLPAHVKTSYRPTSRSDVTFGVRWLATNREVFDEPPASSLPVALPRGGGYGIHFDLREGDLGVALACDGPVFGLYDSGEPVTPQFPQGHDYGCAVFFPCGRVSNEETPTEPPNPAGAMTVGAEDGSATVELRGAGLPSLTEQGTVVIQARTHVPPSFAIFLGSDGALLGVARLTDTVDRNSLMTTWMSQVTAAINSLAPGAVTPFVTPGIGTISSASDKVASE